MAEMSVAELSHPRLKHYPHHADYLEHSIEYRPFVLSIGEPNYRSEALNTDEFGFRVQHYADGEAIQFRDLRSRVEECNLILGGSTAFGVTASRDEKTIASYLGRAGLPCVNWGMRGATSQQELLLYLSLKYLLPRQRNIVLFSGMNDVSLAMLPGALRFPAFGAVFSEDFLLRRFLGPSTPAHQEVTELTRLHERIEHLWKKHRFVRRLARFLGRADQRKIVLEQTVLSAEEQFEIICRLVANAIETWGWVQKASGARVHYLLQPAIGWSRKPLSPVESECFQEDLRRIASVKRFTDRALYLRFRQHVERACASAAVAFHDTNEWLEAPELRGEDIFTDSCHFNDRGYELMATLMRHRLDWY